MTLRHGYFTGAGYTYRAYREPSPEHLALLCLLRGQRPPDLAGPFRVLELGSGQGVQLCIQAANYPQANFLGVDFNPEHVAHGRSLAAAAGLTNIQFQHGDFLELAENPADLGNPFDLVFAHGILGWVSPTVGAAMLRLSSAVLRPGGLFYVSYNTLPGWLPVLPFQHAIRSLQATSGDGLAALEGARSLFASLQEADAQVFRAQPGLSQRLDGLNGQEQSYLLHEYNNSAWQPLYANQVIDSVQELGLSFLGSALLAENFDGLVPEPYRKVLQEHQNEAFKELVRDLLINKSFRRDVFVKGRDPLWPGEALAALNEVRLLRLAEPDVLEANQAFQFRLSFGEIAGNRDWYRELIDTLGDHPISLAELRTHYASIPLPELLQNLSLLIGNNAMVQVPPERDRQPAHRFNACVADRVASGAPYRFLACPVSGNIHGVSDIDLLAVHALQKGRPEHELSAALAERLRALSRQPLRDGRPLEGEELDRSLDQMAGTFLKTTLPLLRRLGAVP